MFSKTTYALLLQYVIMCFLSFNLYNGTFEMNSVIDSIIK